MGSGNLIDSLTYSYKDSSNMLLNVKDLSLSSEGFKDVVNTSDYGYDANGNLNKDLNKGLTSITYNFLNLPSEVRKNSSNTIVYIYDAIGNKLEKSATVSGVTTLRYYTGSFEYGNTKALELIHSDEGVINYSGSTYTYEYHLKDHLGNIRAAFTVNNNSSTLAQIANYYPFGMISKDSTLGNTSNKYLYNGKELQDESLGGVSLEWYDYGSRFLDPQIGRWTTQDPLAEKYESWSTYQYVRNNPIMRIDPDGQSDEWVQKEDKSIYWDKNATSQETTKAGETYLGKAVVAFEGSKNEKLGEDGTLTGDGAISANVTVFGPKGKDDVQQYRGLTVSSDPDKYPMLAEGQYAANYSPMAKSLYGDNERTKERGIPGALTYSLSQNGNTNLPVEGGVNKSTGFSFMTEAFIHRTDWNGKATNSSQGCLVIDGRQYGRFENQLGKAMSISVSLIRK